MEVSEFQILVRKAASRKTSVDEANWREENPLWGHCAVVALLAQDYFGGNILRASLEDTPFAEGRSHYRNEISDFTEEQFGDVQLNLTFEPRTREYLLSNENTAFRYILLRNAFDLLLKDV